MDLSVQINYSTLNGGRMTRCRSVTNCLDVARELQEQGASVGSIAVYDYDYRKPRLLGIWHGAEGNYFGRWG
jgi:hypothetical protein